MLNREAARTEILEAVRQMARAHPDSDYSTAREQFGLLGQIKQICRNAMPTARQCWESIGLDRSKLVDEFTFAQEDLRRAIKPELHSHQSAAIEFFRKNPSLKLDLRTSATSRRRAV